MPVPWFAAPPMNPAPTLRGAVAFSLPPGDAGVAKTISLVRAQVDQAIKNPYINRTAIEILQSVGAPQYDDAAAARVIYEWVRQNIRYVKDPVGKETVRPANVILEVRAGDCDDINGVLLPSLLGTIGIPTRAVTVAAFPGSNEFSHIYAEALINGAWTPVDAARSHVAFGQAPEFYTRRKEWPLTGTEIDQVGLLGGAMRMGQVPVADSSWVSAIGSEATNIISVLRAAPQNLQNPNAPVVGPMVLTPSGTYAAGGPTGAAISGNISGTEMVVGLVLLAGLFVAMRKF